MGLLERVPPGVAPEGDALRFETVVAGAAHAAHVLRPLVDGLAVPADAQDEQFAEVGRERRDAVHVAGLPAARRLHPGMAPEGAAHPDALALQRRHPRLAQRRLGVGHVEPVGHVGRPSGEGVAVGLDAERVEQHRQQGGLVDGHHRVDELEQVVALVEGRPHRVADRRVAVQLVGEPQQRRFERRPPGGAGALGDPAHVVGGEPDETGRRRVVGPQVAVLREPRRAQYQQLAVAGGNRRPAGDVDAERHHRVDQLGHVQQRSEGVADAHLGGPAVHPGAVLFRPRRLRQGRDARLGQADGLRRPRRIGPELRLRGRGGQQGGRGGEVRGDAGAGVGCGHHGILSRQGYGTGSCIMLSPAADLRDKKSRPRRPDRPTRIARELRRVRRPAGICRAAGAE